MQKGSRMKRSGERTHSRSLEGRLPLPKGHRRGSLLVESGRKDGFAHAVRKLIKLADTADKEFKVPTANIDFVQSNFSKEGKT